MAFIMKKYFSVGLTPKTRLVEKEALQMECFHFITLGHVTM